MYDALNHTPHTAHTLNKVPFVIIGGGKINNISNGKLSDIAPTILHIMNLNKPDSMTGVSLIT
jgi:2,3-bisphosphoglycerate-independent phosphoglycerate mutase